ncbi:MAG: hypothetical protein U9N54_03280, partial [candidate division Zixibacteria bacterium]|nr:hypothetical protein [candidate division Zixibacteria bacterium]
MKMNKKIVRFYDKKNDDIFYGQLEDNHITTIIGSPLEKELSSEIIEIDDNIKFLPPVEPSKIVCIGLNYHAHVKASHSADKAPERPL